MTSTPPLAELESPACQAAGDSTIGRVRKQSIDDLPGMDSVFSAEGAQAPSAGETAELRKYLLFRFWTTAKGFWSRNHGDRLAWLLTGSLFVLIFGNLAAQFGINLWNRKIFDALEQRDSTAVLSLSFIFFPLAAASVAIGVTNQRETALVWDRATGKPIHNAIVWQDRRTADVCQALMDAGHEPAVMAKTGLGLDPYFTATKIAWMLDAVPGARATAGPGTASRWPASASRGRPPPASRSTSPRRCSGVRGRVSRGSRSRSCATTSTSRYRASGAPSTSS